MSKEDVLRIEFRRVGEKVEAVCILTSEQRKFMSANGSDGLRELYEKLRATYPEVLYALTMLEKAFPGGGKKSALPPEMN